MNKTILNRAIKIIYKLSRRYDGFINVVFDNWRGFRFVFDTKDVRRCNNDCKNCRLYNFLQEEGISKNFFGLFPATKKDKILFGPQRFLNCKTLKQYENCFVKFILQKNITKKEIRKELNLIKNFRVIFSKNREGANVVEDKLRNSTIKKISGKTPKNL